MEIFPTERRDRAAIGVERGDPPRAPEVDDLFRLALDEFTEKGYDAASLNRILTDAGISVHTIPSYELPRGRGGPRCMSCPVRRDPL